MDLIYKYHVIWSEEDNEYVGLCVEFPSLSFLAKDQEAALHGIKALVKDLSAELQEKNEIAQKQDKL